MEDSEDNKSVIYRCNGVNCRKKKGKRLEHYIESARKPLVSDFRGQNSGAATYCFTLKNHPF